MALAIKVQNIILVDKFLQIMICSNPSLSAKISLRYSLYEVELQLYDSILF